MSCAAHSRAARAAAASVDSSAPSGTISREAPRVTPPRMYALAVPCMFTLRRALENASLMRACTRSTMVLGIVRPTGLKSPPATLLALDPGVVGELGAPVESQLLPPPPPPLPPAAADEGDNMREDCCDHRDEAPSNMWGEGGTPPPPPLPPPLPPPPAQQPPPLPPLPTPPAEGAGAPAAADVLACDTLPPPPIRSWEGREKVDIVARSPPPTFPRGENAN